jgi:YVTN family beta-propeller protein
LLACGLAAAALGAGAPAAGAQSAGTQDVLFVGNNWDGTADVIDVGSFQRLARLNIIPDRDQRIAEIQLDPPRLGYFLGIRQLVGEGHDQFVDDMFSSHDGRFLYVSRPSFADVAAFDLATGNIVWRTRVDGYRADHMAISPDGTRLLVSASTAKVVDVIDTRDGAIVGRFPSGDQPHENNYSRDGTLIFHASIGAVYTPLAEPEFSLAKGERVFEIVDARTLQVLRKVDMGKKLEEAGYPGMSSAVRPMALSPDERYLYFQVSFFHGFVEYDLHEDRVLRLAHLPLTEKSAKLRREEYVLNSAHHGLSMNPEGTKLCAAGTMSDYAAIVSRRTFSYRIVPVGEKPYWTTNSGDGRYCFVSVSGNNRVSVISYATEEEVARIPVGYHPQRMRMGRVPASGPIAGVVPTARRRGARRCTVARAPRPRRRTNPVFTAVDRKHKTKKTRPGCAKRQATGKAKRRR